MKPINNFNPQPAAEASEKLPVGAYVGVIKNVQIEDTKWGQKLALMLDVSEGEYAGFYKKQYEQSTYKDKKYKGILRLSIPDGGQYDEIQRRNLANAVWAVEQSNSGYHWDWDETKLKGKTVGFVVRPFDWALDDGRTGESTEIGKLVTVQAVREGKVKPMKKRELKDKDRQKVQQREQELQQMEEAMDEEIPF